MAKIHVVVVESHNHALEHIHTKLRQCRLLNQDWSMLHFDAHADLACPGQHIPAILCYRPQMSIALTVNESIAHCEKKTCQFTYNEKAEDGTRHDSDLIDDDDDLNSTGDKNLYELLDSTSSGIAEWILPLVLAANLRSICWIRAPKSIPLIPSGVHDFHVGVVHVKSEIASTTSNAEQNVLTSFLELPLTALVKVDWDCRYYLEDDSFVPTADLMLKQPLQLTVKEGPEESDVSIVSCDESLKTSKELNKSRLNHVHAIDVCLDYFLCYNPFLKDIESISSTFAKALHDAFIQSKLYSNSYHTSQSTSNFSVELFAFRQQFKKVLEALPDARLHEDQLMSMIPFYDNAHIALELFDRLQNAFDGSVEEYKKIIDLSIEALPYLTMPHTTGTLEMGEVDEALIQRRLAYMRNEILEYSGSTSEAGDTPFIVTIARSTEDGFTPCHVVDRLQDIVLSEIHSIYCGCNKRVQTRRPLYSSNSGQASSLFDVDLGCWNLVLDY